MSEQTILAIDGESLSIEDVFDVARAPGGSLKILIDPRAKERMEASRKFVLDTVKKGKPVYGINTGFGALSDTHIAPQDLEQLQVNLIRSHCTGVGKSFDREHTRAIMLLRANCLVKGFSGINPEIVELLLEMLNRDILPQIPEKGSVGASGDLAPLAHMSLPIIGEGLVSYKGKLVKAEAALSEEGLIPVSLGPKDGLALINGTTVMAALGCLALSRAYQLVRAADISSVMTLEAVQGTDRAFYSGISVLKPHPGQREVSDNLLKLIEGSEIRNNHKDCDRVQDPYSLRCIPQVHGSVRQTLKHAQEVLEIEINSVTDNPLIFVQEQEIVSGGNFHGEALALCMDYLGMGLSELGNISERRIEKMMNPTFSSLPPFLTANSGLNSGLMIAQVTSAALASENKVLCHPASVDSIPTSTDKEDHVSMGVSAGRKLKVILENVQYCLAIELLCNTQAREFLHPLKSSPALEAVYQLVREYVQPIGEDRVLAPDIENIYKLIDNNLIISTAEKHIGRLN